MPPTSEPGAGGDAPVVLVDGLEAFGLARFEGPARRAVRAALAAQSRSPTAGAEVSLTFVGDDRIAALNARWLGREGPTDVISFGLGRDPIVADIYVAVDTARDNARRFDVPTDEELLRLVVHGVLHAVGYDHPEGKEREASAMFALQEELLGRLLEGRSET